MTHMSTEQNTLKPESPGVIAELRAASLRCLMLTGDNLLTAVSVARSGSHHLVCHHCDLFRNCGLLSEGETVSVVSHTKDELGTYSLHFQDSGGGEGGSLSPPHTKHRLLAITGKTWAVALTHFPGLVQSTLHTTANPFTEFKHSSIALDSPISVQVPRLLLRTAVWARMSPDQKAAVVEATQQLGYVTAMCGDGANDCGALKVQYTMQCSAVFFAPCLVMLIQPILTVWYSTVSLQAAHVGVSLSEAEASVAAPFTSAVPNISCIPRCSTLEVHMASPHPQSGEGGALCPGHQFRGLQVHGAILHDPGSTTRVSR